MAMSREACLVCGKPLEYSGRAQEFTCILCGKSFSDNVRCVAGHYICSSCHAKDAGIQALRLAEGCRSANPIEVMDLFMGQQQTHMHGPEHHILVPVALLTACKNAGADYDLGEAVREAFHRGCQVPGGTCGLWGSCGAAIGTGIFLSIAVGSTPLKSEHYGDVNRITSRCLARIADTGGPRCCKRNSYLSILEAVDYASERFGVTMDIPSRITCTYHERNKECIADRCPFFA